MDNNFSRAEALANKILKNKLAIKPNYQIESYQIQKQSTLLRLEKVFTNISDNVYNLGGVYNAQLTSMQETKKSLKERYQKEKLLNLESNLEKKNYTQKIYQSSKQSLDLKTSSLDDLLKSFQSLLDAAHSGYELFDLDKNKRKQRKQTRKNSKAKIKAKIGPIMDIGKKFLGKLPLIGAVLTVGEGIYKTLEEDDDVTESRGGPLASFVYNTADSLIENLSFGLLDLKKVQEAGKVLSESEQGKIISEKNRKEIQGMPSSELDFMTEGQTYTEEPSKATTRSLTVTETSEQRLKRLGITPSSLQGGRGSYKPPNVTPSEEAISLDELIEKKKAQHDKNIVTTSDGSVLVDSYGNPVRSSSFEDFVESVVKKEKEQPQVAVQPQVSKPAAPPPSKPPEPVSKPLPSGPSGVIQTIIGSLKQAGISSLSAIGNIIAQIKAESNFVLRSENMNYKSAQQIQNTFGRNRIPTLEFAQQFVGNPEALANYVYKNTDGNSEYGDGYKYRGRGWIQHTGKNQYAALSKYLGVDLLSNPDQLNDPILATKALLWFFLNYKKLKPTDLEDNSKLNKAIAFSDPSGSKALSRAADAEAIKARLSSGEELSASSIGVAAAKKQNNQGQTIVNVDNSSISAVKVGAPQGSPVMIARPVT